MTKEEQLKKERNIGGLIGKAKGAIIKNCRFEGKIIVNGLDANVGGLIGSAENTEVINSTAKAEITYSTVDEYLKKVEMLPMSKEEKEDVLYFVKEAIKEKKKENPNNSVIRMALNWVEKTISIGGAIPGFIQLARQIMDFLQSAP